MSFSSGNTFCFKKIYAIYGDVSPFNLLMVQCLLNLLICTCLMASKSLGLFTFESWKPYGIDIPTLGELVKKWKVGLQSGGGNLGTVIFGLFAVKNSTIPLFLCFRRSAILATVICVYFIKGEKPNSVTSITTVMVTSGALIAGAESFEKDLSGFVLTMANNFSQSLQNIFMGYLNENKVIQPFGKYNSDMTKFNRLPLYRNQCLLLFLWPNFLSCLQLHCHK